MAYDDKTIMEDMLSTENLSAEITTHLQTSGPAKPPKTNLLKF